MTAAALADAGPKHAHGSRICIAQARDGPGLVLSTPAQPGDRVLRYHPLSTSSDERLTGN